MKALNYKSIFCGKWSSAGWELLLLAFFSIALTACNKEVISGSGVVITETRQVPAFSDVVAEGSFRVHLRQGTDGPVEVTADDNVMKAIDTYVSGSTLHLRIKNGVKLHTSRDIDIYVSSTQYYGVSFSGAGSVESLDTIKTNRFSYKMDGSGNARFRIVTDRLETTVDGSGNIQLFGSATNFYSEINGSGDISGLDLNCQDANLSVKGSGNHTLSVSHSLDVSIRGSGDVRYKGAATIRSDIKGSGKIIKL
ncbi:Putative auto-transporter adhesin, head GIN domain [Chitinophaga sp. YR627]|uniref:head GIN domain-containing protein n=1 Tax=Chitinophaga sp. YR627 TaxID=1881041 RepID=UPI0008ED1B35|nr:head GIN domain-containing protein [Chitinophaga sp. YR627]SFN94427.1 Putative auto-transporter adhesin, head GIN domain [Chitinophaga sp. YR627]